MKIRRRSRERLSEYEGSCQALLRVLAREELLLAQRERSRLASGEAETEVDREVARRLREEWEKAHELVREVISVNPGRADNHVSLGLCLEHLGRFDEASLSYREAMRLEPAAGFENLLDVLEAHAKALRLRMGDA